MRSFLLTLIRNPISLAGTALTTASALIILAFLSMELLGFEGSPYIGILTFLILPAFFVLGLLLIPLGELLHRRRRRLAACEGKAASTFPVIDLNVEKIRGLVLGFIGLTIVNIAILATASYKGVEIMDSTAFCGTTCHTVMIPEFTTYQRSPHARVTCVSCHIGPGAGWFVKSKLSGSWQLIAVTFNLYPRPIATPIENLRPARETCEQCHWPTKFVGDRLKILTRFAEDETNTEQKTVLLLRVGGQMDGESQGIHWHVDPGNRIRYRSDKTREQIFEVELARADGTIETFVSAAENGKSDEESKSSWRTMDCVDCHNRPTHIYRMPQDEIDMAMQQGRLDRSLPLMRREGLKTLQENYPSHEEARRKIRQRIVSFYSTTYPDIAGSKAEQIERAAKSLGDIYCANVFPWMNIRWGTYPNHIGHRDTPGCFRCHDDMHKSASGKTISQDCSTCHTMLAMEEPNPAILQQLQP